MTDDIETLQSRLEEVARRLILLEAKQRNFEQELRADIAAAMSRVITIQQQQDLKIQHMRELLQSYEMTMHVIINHVKRGTDPIKEATRMLQEGQRKWAASLARMIGEHFNEDELINLVFDLGWDYEGFDGDNKNAKIRSIVEYARRRNTLQLLAGLCQELRSGIQWPLSSVDI